MNTALLSLGTNLGNKIENLNAAIIKMQELGAVRKISSVYQTPSWGFKSNDFYNIAVALQTDLDAASLITKLLEIENYLGRIRSIDTPGYQARPLDIDILFFNNSIIDTPSLTIPHPRIQDRKFVLVPLIEIAPNYKHPFLNKYLKELLETTMDNSTLTKTAHQLQA